MEENEMRNDIMIDLETLGTDVNATIFQISAIKFDIKTGEILDEFNKIINIKTIPNFTVNADTLKWWLKTNPTLLADLIVTRGVDDYRTSLCQFSSWVHAMKGGTFLWGNGISFDNVILRQSFINSELIYPIKYTHDRDVRTILHLAMEKSGIHQNDIKGMFEDKNATLHDARNDTIHQIKYVVWSYNTLTSNTMEER